MQKESIDSKHVSHLPSNWTYKVPYNTCKERWADQGCYEYSKEHCSFSLVILALVGAGLKNFVFKTGYMSPNTYEDHI